MFDFFVKREKVVIDFFCDLSAAGSNLAFQMAKPDFSVKHYPDWFKKTPASVDLNEIGVYDEPIICPHTGKGPISMTVKTCQGVLELYKQSITIPSWFVMEADVDNKGVSIKCPAQEVVSHSCHPNIQFDQFVKKEDAVNFKLDTPWMVQSKPNIHIMLSQPGWDNYYRYRYMSVLPGIMNLKYTNEMKVNYLLDVPKDSHTVYTTRWDVLDPLVHLIPITDKEVEIRHHLIDVNTMKKLKPVSDFMGDDNMILKGPRWSHKSRKKLVDKLEKLDPKLWGDK